MDRQPAPIFDSNDHQGQLLPLQKDSEDADPTGQNGNDPIKNLKKNKKNRHVVIGIKM